MATAGCAAAADGCEQAIAPALQKVLDWPHDAFSFAVAEHRPTGGFVQYAFDGGLYIDIPARALSTDERRAVEALFGDPTWVTATNPATGAISSLEAFQRHFASDAPAAARFGCRVLRQVFAMDADAAPAVSFHGDPPHDANDGSEPPLDLTLRKLGAAADSGDAEAQYALATLLAEHAADEQTRATAGAWLRKAATQGHPAAIAALRSVNSQQEGHDPGPAD